MEYLLESRYLCVRDRLADDTGMCDAPRCFSYIYIYIYSRVFINYLIFTLGLCHYFFLLLLIFPCIYLYCYYLLCFHLDLIIFSGKKDTTVPFKVIDAHTCHTNKSKSINISICLELWPTNYRRNILSYWFHFKFLIFNSPSVLLKQSQLHLSTRFIKIKINS